MSYLHYILVVMVLALFVSITRFFIPTTPVDEMTWADVYKDFSHLFIAYILGVSWAWRRPGDAYYRREFSIFCKWIVLILIAVEVFCAFILRHL